jgi:hypothetical protein
VASRKKTRLDDRVFKRLRAKVEGIGDARVKVGVLASKGGGAVHDDSGITMVELAAIHEFGSPAANIPERSFIRRTFAEKNTELVQLQARVARALIAEKVSVTQALNVLGAWAAGEIKKTVTAGPHIPPPLKPETVARKGSDRPLVDTGRLVDAITWEVE